MLPGISDYGMGSLSLTIEACPFASIRVYTYRNFNRANGVGILNLLGEFFDNFDSLSNCGSDGHR